jgi:hypothetical protein
MNNNILFAILVSTSCVACGQETTSQSDSLVGTWRLMSIGAHSTDGTVTQHWGAEPLGFWFFDVNGFMSVQIVDPDHKLFESGDFLRPTPEEANRAITGYFGYFGTYTADKAAGEVVFHVEGAAYPNYVGTDQQRDYSIEGDTLTVQTPPERAGDEDVTYVATLVREQ